MIASAFRPLRGLTVTLGDTDDAMRLVQARALLHGRAWWDLVEPRLGPPHGLEVHWSRLIDGPLAGLIGLCQSVLGAQTGELAARALWPMLLFVPFAIALLKTAQRLGGTVAVWFAAAIAPLCWLLAPQFLPGRLDHDNVQLALIAWMMLCSLSAERPRAAALMGALAGVSLAIGYEGLVVVAWTCGLIVVRYIALKGAEKPAFAFGLSLAVTTAALFLVQTPPSWWTRMTCDALGANMVAGVGLAGFGLAALARLAGADWRIRTIGAGLVGAAGLGLLFALHPICLHGPYAEIDPRIAHLWLDRVGEASPIWKWLPQRPMEAISGSLLPLAAFLAATIALARGERDAHLLSLTALLALCLIESAIEARGFVLATTASIPIAAYFVARIKRADMITPMAAGLALGLLTSPLATLSFLKLALPGPVRASEAAASIDQSDCLKIAAMDGLKALPRGVVLADLDAGPAILATTAHSVIGAPYHRLGQQIFDVMTVFNAPIPQAAAILARERPDYVAVCRKGVVRHDDVRGSLGAALLRGAPPPWLTPLPSSHGEYALFRVRRDLLAAHDGLKGRFAANS